MVREFHEAFAHPVEDFPIVPSPELVELRVELVREELEELDDAAAADDLVEVADALADLVYVIEGAALVWGVDVTVPLVPVEVHDAFERFAEASRAAAVPGDATLVSVALGELLAAVETLAGDWDVPLAACVVEVHDSNMSKLGGDGRPLYRDDGKILKGPSFRCPDIAAVLAAR